jgi:hypothetical protein
VVRDAWRWRQTRPLAQGRREERRELCEEEGRRRKKKKLTTFLYNEWYWWVIFKQIYEGVENVGLWSTP